MKHIKLVPAETNYPFLKMRIPALIFSIAMMVLSVGLFAVRGVNLGIDFAGGNMIEIGTDGPADLAQIRGILGELNLGDVSVQEFGAPDDVQIRIERQAGDEAAGIDDNEAQAQVIELVRSTLIERIAALEFTRFDYASGIVIEAQGDKFIDIPRFQDEIAPEEFEGLVIEHVGGDTAVRISAPSQPTKGGMSNADTQALVAKKIRDTLNAVVSGLDFRRIETVGPTVSGELVQDGILSIGIAVALVLVYIWFRFEWHFGVGAVIALVHDVVLTVGFFAATQLEFNLSIIAAILTIIGYSLNDTVVVYDRIREKLRKFQKMELTELLNNALNKTLSRTLMTSITTLIVLLSLFFFGGTVIQGFTAAMIWGVFVGTYSSIFIATPALVYLKLRRSAFDDAEPIEKQFS